MRVSKIMRAIILSISLVALAEPVAKGGIAPDHAKHDGTGKFGNEPTVSVFRKMTGGLFQRSVKAPLVQSDLDTMSQGKPGRFLRKVVNVSDVSDKVKSELSSKLCNVITSCSIDALSKPVKFCLVRLSRAKKNHVPIYRYSRYGGRHHNGDWEISHVQVVRGLDSVVLPKETKQLMLEDLHWFTQDKTECLYRKLGIPYHRGYLFHGKPGTGKTSFIHALAGHFRRILCDSRGLAKMYEEEVHAAMRTTPDRAMLVYEDVDSLFSEKRCNAAEFYAPAASAMSFSCFINMLDGPDVGRGVVIFMTSNHPERLDPALVRPGRVDIKVAFEGAASFDIAKQYFMRFYPGKSQAAASFAGILTGRVGLNSSVMAQLQLFFLACDRKGLGPQDAARHIRDFNFEDMQPPDSQARQSSVDANSSSDSEEMPPSQYTDSAGP